MLHCNKSEPPFSKQPGPPADFYDRYDPDRPKCEPTLEELFPPPSLIGAAFARCYRISLPGAPGTRQHGFCRDRGAGRAIGLDTTCATAWPRGHSRAQLAGVLSAWTGTSKSRSGRARCHRLEPPRLRRSWPRLILPRPDRRGPICGLVIHASCNGQTRVVICANIELGSVRSAGFQECIRSRYDFNFCNGREPSMDCPTSLHRANQQATPHAAEHVAMRAANGERYSGGLRYPAIAQALLRHRILSSEPVPRIAPIPPGQRDHGASSEPTAALVRRTAGV